MYHCVEQTKPTRGHGEGFSKLKLPFQFLSSKLSLLVGIVREAFRARHGQNAVEQTKPTRGHRELGAGLSIPEQLKSSKRSLLVGIAGALFPKD